MKIAVLADPLDHFKIYKDTTFAMMAEAARRAHTLYAFEQSDMALQGGEVVANVKQVTLTGAPDVWYHASAPVSTPLHQFDAILLRKDPPFDMEYIYTTYLLERAEAQGVRVINKPSAVRAHNEKLAIAEFPQFIAPTIVTRDEHRLRAFHAEHHDVIFKPLDGMGGAGIFRVGMDERNLGSVIEMLTENGARTIMAQRFIPEVAAGDKRILLIGDQVVPYSLARIPQGTEVRGNLAAGGVGVAQPITARDREIAETLAPILAQRGLLLVGLDAIGDYLTELNVTSPTCLVEITEQTGFNVASLFIDALEAACGSRGAH